MSEETMQEARFYEATGNGKVLCRLCPHHCRLPENGQGRCRVRKNIKGKLYTLNYGLVTSSGLDPIEKKPLYHFYPGSCILSVGTFGCNFHCRFCQNWEIAHGDPVTEAVNPEQLVRLAEEARERSGSIGLAYTYSEPLVWYEYVYDCARVAHQRGLKNVLVTNGAVEQEPLQELLPYLDAMNIDLKSFTSDYYRKLCRGELEPVLRTVKAAHGRCHLELTTLLVTGLNDGEEELTELVNWVAELDPGIPLHFSRYFPHYQLDLPPTPLKTMVRAQELARRRLRYVYLGNVWELGEEANNTYCPVCGNLLVRRDGYRVTLPGLQGRTCRKCGSETELVVTGE